MKQVDKGNGPEGRELSITLQAVAQSLLPI